MTRTQFMDLELSETKELLRVERARAKAAERAVNRLAAAFALRVKPLDPAYVRAWAYGAKRKFETPR